MEQDLPETPIWGAKKIGEVIGKPPNQTFHLLKSGQLPATKIGDTWCAFPSRLRARLRGEVVS